jgi:hypothetical protein
MEKKIIICDQTKIEQLLLEAGIHKLRYEVEMEAAKILNNNLNTSTRLEAYQEAYNEWVK